MKGKILSLAIILVMVLGSFGAVGTNLEKENENYCGCNDNDIVDEEKQKTYTNDLKPVSERSFDELCGLVEPVGWRNEGIFNNDITVLNTLPDNFDWREPSKNYIGRKCTSSVKDQGSCGSCWAFGTVGPLESAILIREAVEEDLSEQWLVSCNTKGYGCSGGWWAHDWHAGRAGKCGGTGAVYETDFPYTATTGSCGNDYPHVFLVDDWQYVGSSNGVPGTGAIKQAIYDYGPVSAAVTATNAWPNYNGGIWSENVGGNVNHAIVIVGWDDDMGSDGVWIIKNSWGEDWGDQGYMYIEYGCSNIGYSTCYIDGYERLSEGDETVNLYIHEITNEGDEYEPIDPIIGREPEWYYTVKVGSTYTESNQNLKTGDAPFWPWDWKSEYTWEARQGHVAYVEDKIVDIKIYLYDNDPGPTDDQADISPKSDKAFLGKYNLATGELKYTDGTDVSKDGSYFYTKGIGVDNAKVIFLVTDSFNEGPYKPKISVDTTDLNFGTVSKGTHSKTFKITNAAPYDDNDWTEKLSWSASDNKNWISLDVTSGSLAGGASKTVSVTIDTSNFGAGTSDSGVVTVTSNDKFGNDEIKIDVSAAVDKSRNRLLFYNLYQIILEKLPLLQLLVKI